MAYYLWIDTVFAVKPNKREQVYRQKGMPAMLKKSHCIFCRDMAEVKAEIEKAKANNEPGYSWSIEARIHAEDRSFSAGYDIFNHIKTIAIGVVG
jgi:hypothetical protein